MENDRENTKGPTTAAVSSLNIAQSSCSKRMQREKEHIGRDVNVERKRNETGIESSKGKVEK